VAFETGRTYLLDGPAITSFEEFVAAGGGSGLARALQIGDVATIEEISASGLRGRGGGGFSTGRKWSSVRAGESGTRFVVVNAAEGEPATFKDRALIRHDPYRILEGAAIAAFSVGAGTVYVATKASYTREVAALTKAAVEMTAAGMLQELAVNVVQGPDEYLFGEEKAMLEVIEGRDPLPRVLPPYEVGLFAATPAGGWESKSRPVTAVAEANPTVVNNAETLASAAHIMANGASWFRSMGTERSPGTVVVTLVGDVVTPGVHEVEMGTPLQTVLDMCGGPRPGRLFKAAFSGVSNAVIPAGAFDTPLTYEHFDAIGSGLGAAGFVVYDDSVNMTSVAYELSRFLAVESCGQCPPCKQGSLSITGLLADIHNGAADTSVLGELTALLRSVTDANRCFLGTEEQRVVSSILQTFPDDVSAFVDHTVGGVRLVHVPLIKDITDDGTVVLDDTHQRKRADWTYETEGGEG
jgi:NADH-quinone oxidoreductase subunit F